VVGKALLSFIKRPFWLGDVYFNQFHMLALTALSTYWGSACGTTAWKIFEKSLNGRWEQRPWVFCGGIAGDEEKAQRRRLGGDSV